MTQEEKDKMLYKAFEMHHELCEMHKTIYESKEFSKTAKNIISLACDSLSALIDMLF